MTGAGGRRWQTWHLLAVALVSLVLGAAAGGTGASEDRAAKKRAEAAKDRAESALAAAKALNADLEVKAGAATAAADSLRRATSTTGVPATPAPSIATTTTTPGPRTSFTEGTFRVGVDIAPGTYSAPGTSGNCYWARLSNLTGQNDIIANHLDPGPASVTILASDVAFSTSRCGIWTKV